MGNDDQTGSWSTLAVFETLSSSTDYYMPPNRNGSQLAGSTMVACYLAELWSPTDESHPIRSKGRKVP